MTLVISWGNAQMHFHRSTKRSIDFCHRAHFIFGCIWTQGCWAAVWIHFLSIFQNDCGEQALSKPPAPSQNQGKPSKQQHHQDHQRRQLGTCSGLYALIHNLFSTSPLASPHPLPSPRTQITPRKSPLWRRAPFLIAQHVARPFWQGCCFNIASNFISLCKAGFCFLHHLFTMLLLSPCCCSWHCCWILHTW